MYGQIATAGAQVVGGMMGGGAPQPNQTYVGGSAGALDERRDRYLEAEQAGQERLDQGASLLSQAGAQLGRSGNMAYEDRSAGTDLARQYGQRADGARSRQYGQLAGAVETARERGPSVADAQMQAAIRQTAEANRAQATLGGPLAMREAANANAEMARRAGGDAAAARAMEEANYRNSLINAQLGAGAQYGTAVGQNLDQAARGLQMRQAGTAQSASAAAQMGQVGGALGNLGNASTGMYLDANLDTDRMQLQADQAYEAARIQAANQQKAQDAATIGGVSNAVGSLWG